MMLLQCNRHSNPGHCIALPQVAETCQLALQRIDFYSSAAAAQLPQESRYLSVDPAPAAPASTPTAELRATLLDEHSRIFDRYRAMFALRNKGGPEAVEALGQAFEARSALLKHEVAYVLGQMQDRHAVEVLRCVKASPNRAGTGRDANRIRQPHRHAWHVTFQDGRFIYAGLVPNALTFVMSTEALAIGTMLCIAARAPLHT